MKYVLDAARMKAADYDTITSLQIPSAVLMERAALAVCDTAEEFFDLPQKKDRPILVVCGSGNNGGDGYAAARILSERGYTVHVLFAGNAEHRSEECIRQAEIWKRICLRQNRTDVETEPDRIRQTAWGLIIDAVFGIGLTRDIEGRYRDVIETINDAGCPVAAVDIPSGVDTDNGRIRGIAVRADLTVTFAAPKYGHLLFPGRDFCGVVRVCPIGIPVPVSPGMVLEEDDLKAMLPERQTRSNKGSYGRALIAAGGPGMAGAAYLAAKSAYRCGTGLVTAAVHASNRTILQSTVPEAVYLSWDQEERLTRTLDGIHAAAVGPGLGTGEDARRILQLIRQHCRTVLVADADALNLIAEQGLLHSEDPAFCCHSLIITPHPGEMARLCGISVSEVCRDPVKTAVEFAAEHHLICVLKDAVSVITDGQRICLNQSGCDGMATGGSGDVLAGMICGLAAQGMEPFEAACAAAFLHGTAGRVAGSRKGMRSMTSVDLCEAIPDAFLKAGVL